MTRRFKILKIVSGTIFSSVGLFLILDNFIPVNKCKYSIPEDNLTTVTGYLIKEPYYHKSSGGKGSSTYFQVELNTYPDISFRNEGVFLKATSWKAIKDEVKYNDTVWLKVLKTEFEKKIIKKNSLNIFQHIANSPIDKIEFYSFRFRDKECMSSLYEAAIQMQRDNLFPKFLFGLVFTGMGLYSFLAKK